MNPVVSQDALRDFFAWAPLAVWLAKRHEAVTVPALGATYACANCGRRGSREYMVPQVHDGAVSYYCSHCAS